MTDQEVLQSYKPFVSFLADLCGNGCEVLLHDVSNPEESVIAIANGFHSGRDIGSPMTDLAIKIQQSGDYKTNDYISNYSGKSKDKNFLSSTFFIKNEGRLIGLICVNRDLSSLNELDTLLARVKKQFNLETTDKETRENLDMPVTLFLQALVKNAIQETGVLPTRMSINEKVALVHRLNAQGVLSMKGGVAEIAKQLCISEPTVYRYINRDK